MKDDVSKDTGRESAEDELSKVVGMDRTSASVGTIASGVFMKSLWVMDDQ